MPQERFIRVNLEEPTLRLDAYLAKQELGLSRSHIQGLIGHQGVYINTQLALKSSQKIKPGDLIRILIPDPKKIDMTPENIPLDIVFEDEHLLVINKPAGIVVHPACGNYNGTLVNALLYHCENLSGIGGVQRPGIVHRLDKGTSGLIMAAKSDAAHQSLSKQLKQRTITRRYVALVYGALKQDDGFIENELSRSSNNRKQMMVVKSGGRMAGTYYHVLQRYHLTLLTPVDKAKSFTLVECKLTTGRTHQIRVHMDHLGHPVVGDDLYHPEFINKMGGNIRDMVKALNGFAPACASPGIYSSHHRRIPGIYPAAPAGVPGHLEIPGA